MSIVLLNGISGIRKLESVRIRIRGTIKRVCQIIRKKEYIEILQTITKRSVRFGIIFGMNL